MKLAALSSGISVSQPVTLKTEVDRADLVAWRPDVLVVVAYGLIRLFYPTDVVYEQ